MLSEDALEPPRAAGLKIAADRYPLGLFRPLAVFSGAAMFFGVRAFAPVVGLAGLMAAPLSLRAKKDWTGFSILAALIAWAALSILWSPAPNLHEVASAKALSRFTI